MADLSLEARRENIRSLDRILLCMWLMMFAFMAEPCASLGRAMAFQDAARGALHEGAGLANWHGATRGSPAGVAVVIDGKNIDLMCARRVFSRVADTCPPFDDRWNGRRVVVRWLDIPSGLLGEPVHRAVAVERADAVPFQASADAVVRSEVIGALQGMAASCVVYLPIIGVFMLVARLLRRQLRDAEAEAARWREWRAARSEAGRRPREA